MFNREQKHDKQNAKDLEIAKDETARAQEQKATQKEKYEKQISGLNDENSKLRNSNYNLKSQSDKAQADNEIKDRLLGNQNKANVQLQKNNKNLQTRNANERKQHQTEMANQKANYEGQIKAQNETYAKDIEASKGETARAQSQLAQAKASNSKMSEFIKSFSKKGGGNNGSNTNQ
ncbi:MAG: hypothetical protein J6S85_26315 [Methanobrevibacter sp.]|nr:hypothetical protein [Methanobrevibacter sp.]MBO7717108.1 hypothetical protein [Methanobrevibacter sp.]